MAAADTARRPPTADVVTGAVCTVLSVGLVLALPALTAGDPDVAALAVFAPWTLRWWLFVAGLVVQGTLLVWARRAPRVALLAVAIVAFGLSWLTPGAAYGISSVAVLVQVYRVVIAVPVRRAWSTLASAGVILALGEMLNGIAGERSSLGAAAGDAIAQAAAVVVIPLVIGALVRSRNDVRDARQDERQARTEQRDAQVQAAVSRERTAMARELHDIAAHHLSGIALMAAVVDRQIDTAPEEAHRGARQVRAQSTEVLDDLRRLVGLLRDDTGGERTVEVLAAVPALVDRAQAQGPVELRVLTADGRTLGDGIGPLAQLALYRTIQEALTNASAHAPGAARVVEIDDRDDARVSIVVTNAAPTVPGRGSSAGGFGLVGMSERAQLVGADLSYGPTPAGGWQIRASVPRDSPIEPLGVRSVDRQDAEDCA